jgi:hypothetical protein
MFIYAILVAIVGASSKASAHTQPQIVSLNGKVLEAKRLPFKKPTSSLFDDNSLELICAVDGLTFRTALFIESNEKTDVTIFLEVEYHNSLLTISPALNIWTDNFDLSFIDQYCNELIEKISEKVSIYEIVR